MTNVSVGARVQALSFSATALLLRYVRLNGGCQTAASASRLLLAGAGV
jgi:hypothetical protein